MIPWTTLAWTQVHHGQLPLWNPYSASGTPLAFNWQSATFSLPGPARLPRAACGWPTRCRSWPTLVIVAGTGAYVRRRVLRLHVVACAFAGVAFELSGSFAGWIGWPVASVRVVEGWIVASVILVIREVGIAGGPCCC